MKRLRRKKKKEDRLINNLFERLENDHKYELSRCLLACEKCNLVEDKSLGRPVFTRFVLPDGDYGKATDMSFKEISKDKFECPNCQNIIKAESLDNDMDEMDD